MFNLFNKEKLDTIEFVSDLTFVCQHLLDNIDILRKEVNSLREEVDYLENYID